MGPTIWVSVGRTERIGPTRAGAFWLKTAARRGIPPLMISSYTTSAWSMPHCGRELVSSSTLMTSAERLSAVPDGSGSPVSGAMGPPALVVVVEDVVDGGFFVE